MEKQYSMVVFLLSSLLATMIATSRGTYSLCPSWRLGVETNNIRDWKTFPLECVIYVADYMLGPQYRKDSHVVAVEAARYAGSLYNLTNMTSHGKDIWIFDIDETSLSNLPYFATHGNGTHPIANVIDFLEWIKEANAPALPESLNLYKYLLYHGIKIVFLTERSEDMRNATIQNLFNAGYIYWEKLILKNSSYTGTLLGFKQNQRAKLENDGYKIVGNIGDQWSDLLGIHPGNRTFKLPNPLYYSA